NKNGDSPVDWSCPVSQGIPDKNDILDMMVHIRRAGPGTTDSLWMFGGLSLDNTTGNRYFDFEMYQTDIYYDRGTRQFYNYGPDAGHTSWQFDATGNITRPGDIIFSAEYQSASLSNIEARIWVNRSALSITPVSFDWAGQFDGGTSGATYGYASIKPKAAGTYYTGLQCANATWAGPFGVILQNDALVTDYDAKQYVEFSVNLTKLGLDPVTLLGSNSCGMPFRRILVKTRSSASFTAELKDFVGPFDFFLAPRVQAKTATPYICEGSNIAQIDVTNPVATSFYQWTTPDGNIVSSPTGPTIYVNKPGVYIVTQYLQQGCSAYASDTVRVNSLTMCEVLTANRVYDFRGTTVQNRIVLNWKVQDNQQANFFDVQRSTDGIVYHTVATVANQQKGTYNFQDSVVPKTPLYYRIKLINKDKLTNVSNALRFSTETNNTSRLQVHPNPVKDDMHLQVFSAAAVKMNVAVYNAAGNVVLSTTAYAKQGTNTISLQNAGNRASGICLVVVDLNGELLYQKVLFTK
ncbi:MAG TPA: T9SS type A sorting domain-containing protein, partial [Flavisolibacter sp.]|nr:T9SS type A sorting domain-containing protein [Flavisolibacter sp.]